MLTDQGLAGADLLPEFLSELQAVNKRGKAAEFLHSLLSLH